MYNKVPANMNFVDREKYIEKFWEDEQIFKKRVSTAVSRDRPIHSMTDRLPQTASRTSDTC